MSPIIRCLLLLLVTTVFLTGPALAQEEPYPVTSKQISAEPQILPSGHPLERKRSQTFSIQHPARYSSLSERASSEPDSYDRWARRLAIVQGGYYLATGLWPILHMQSFEKITGPKTDDWLVKTVGGLISVVGGTLIVSGVRDRPSRDLAMVAVGSAAALTAVDIIYVARNRIPPIYLLDAAGETVLMAGWAITLSQ